MPGPFLEFFWRVHESMGTEYENHCIELVEQIIPLQEEKNWDCDGSTYEEKVEVIYKMELQLFPYESSEASFLRRCVRSGIDEEVKWCVEDLYFTLSPDDY